MVRSKMKAKIILMHNLAKKGKFGDCIYVKKGYAKNFLIPNGIALPAIKDNIEKFESLKKEASIKAEKLRLEALELSEKINAIEIVVKANAAQDGKIFGSITSKNILEALMEIDHSISLDKNQIFINIPIKYIGNHSIQFNLNPDVVLTKNISVINLTASANDLSQDEDGDSDTLGYDYSSQVRSGDKRFDYLDKEDS
jgi:large subunit ribosomal protein L9